MCFGAPSVYLSSDFIVFDAEIHMLATFPFSMKWKRSFSRFLFSIFQFIFVYAAANS